MKALQLSGLRKEIRNCMSGLGVNNDGHLCAHFVFPENFIGFKGHFPDNPVLPGICIIQAVLVMLETWRHRTLKLREIVLAKFRSVVPPGLNLQFTCREDGKNEAATLVEATASSNGKRIADLTIRVTAEG